MTPSEPTPSPPRGLVERLLYLAFALLCLALGVMGMWLPVMPTTVFILLAAWAAARSSPRLHGWLLNHPLFGQTIRNWQNGGTVSRKAKRSATLMMGLCALIMPLVGSPLWVVILATSCMACVLVWLWRRPEPAT